MEDNPKSVLILEEDYVNYLLFQEYFEQYNIQLIRVHSVDQINYLLSNEIIHAIIIGETLSNDYSNKLLTTICAEQSQPVFLERNSLVNFSSKLIGLKNCWLIDLFSDSKDIIRIIEDYAYPTLIPDYAYESASQV